MKNIIKYNVIRYICDKRKLIVLAVFAFFCGSEVETAVMANMSIYEYILFVMGNHYYLIYFMLMAYLFFSFESMNEESSLIWIRMKKIRNQFICRMVSILMQTTLFAAAHVIIAGAIGVMKFRLTNQFTAVAVAEYYNDTLNFILEYGKYVRTPGMACLMMVLFLITGLTFLSTLVYVAETLWGKKIAIVLMGILIFNSMVGFKAGIGGIGEVLCFNHYFILHHVLFGNGYPYVLLNLLIEMLVGTAGYVLFKSVKGNDSGKRRNVYLQETQREIDRYSAWFLLLYVVLNAISAALTERKLTALDLVLANLLGYSAGGIDVMEFIRYVLFFLIPVFFIGVILEKEKIFCNSHVAIRYGNQTVWKRLLERNLDRYLVRYVAFWGAVMVILSGLTGLLNGEESQYAADLISYMEISQSELYGMIVVSFFLKVMELFYYKNVFLMWNDGMGSRIAAYVITFLGFLVDFIAPGRVWVSYGASSVYNLVTAIQQNGLMAAVIITPVVMVIKIAAIKLFRQKYLVHLKNP